VLTRERLDAMVDATTAPRDWTHCVRTRELRCCHGDDVPPKTDAPTVTCTIDGVEVTVPAGTTIYTAARTPGSTSRCSCHDERYDPVGVCRMCVVDVGGRVLAAACVRPCEDGMEVKTADARRSSASARADRAADGRPAPATEDPKETTTGDNLLLELASRYEPAHAERLPQARGRGIDDSNPVIHVNHDACILCDRCVRACDDIQGNDVIGRSGKGYATRIAFDLNDPWASRHACTCGECVAACPTAR
jgi:formate dehydrogenase major subunit